MCMFKLSQLTTRIKLQLIDALWKWALLWVFLYNVAGNLSMAGIFTVICLVCFVINVRVILKPLSYPINADTLIEPPEESA